MIQLRSGALFMAFCRPPIAIIGAINASLSSIIDVVWICWMSFVERVISDAVENLLKSAKEKLSIRSNNFNRNFCAIPVAIRAAKKPTTIEQNPPAAVTKIIIKPLFQIADISCLIMPLLTISDILSGSHKFAITTPYVNPIKIINSNQ